MVSYIRRDEAALAKAQRKTAKSAKRTKERNRANTVIRRVHERIRNRRHDFCHQAARRIVNRYGIIAIDKLTVRNMSKSPAPKVRPAGAPAIQCGTFEGDGGNKPDPDSRAEGTLPGATGNEGRFLPNGTSAKAGLNKSILDASWSMFATLLTQKAESAARLVVAVNPAFTSQMCSGCGTIVKKSLSERTHRCLVCDLVLDRDTNAAVNIKAVNIKSVGQHRLATVIA